MKKIIFLLASLAMCNSFFCYSQLINGLVGYWKLDGSAGDATGINNGSLIGTASSTSGKIGSAYQFVPSPSFYISVPNSTSLNISGNTISLSAWARTTSGGTQMIVSKVSGVGTHTDPYFQYNLQFLQGSSLFPRFFLSIGGTAYFAANNTISINYNQWYHIVGTYDGSSMRLYLDGSLIATTAVTGNITSYNTPLYVSKNGALGETFIGSIDEVGIWNRTLSSTEVTQLYNSGNGLSHPFGTASAPAAPSALSATVSSCSQINLSWTDNSNNETGFYIYRGGSQIASVGAGVTSYNNTSLSAGTAYSYYVVAYNGSGNSSNSNTASATTPSCSSVPAAPSGLSASAASCSQINLSWTDNSNNETGFYIYRGGSQIASVGAGITSYSNTGLSASTPYSYYVIANNASGNSSNSNTVNASTPACSGSWNHTATQNIIMGSYWLSGDGNNEGIRINANGNVGIGTNTDFRGLLTVNGKIFAEEIEVVSSIASDYVFEPEYELMPLTELEIYLKKNKHLPGIPSALEFREKGQNLGEMQDMLLRKIEELTLYVIKQQQTITEQQKAIKTLQSEVNSIKRK